MGSMHKLDLEKANDHVMERSSSAVKRVLKNTFGMVPVAEDLENLSEEDVKHMKKRQLQEILKGLVCGGLGMLQICKTEC
ncbi:hypothetical protein GOP47_0000864 [Adiantum capillus-veneris]|uniref:Uncharacterized protein n=1 Tax=Adiantum capillus-veneris TaxID=13818 RepID=A0A9D4VER9_ADICA|nr:hypothetical protein GOP47_0000864 [Adiantum capillus-veneris]